MADKNKRSAHATKTAGNMSRSAPEFSAALNLICTHLSELCTDSEGFKDYNKIHNSEKRLKSELEKKDQELQSIKVVNEAFRKQNEELINEKGLLKREFMLSAAEWTSDEEKFSQVKCLLKETQSKLDTATQEIRRLSKSLDSSQMELAKSQKDAAGLEDRLEITNFELQKFQVERRMFNKESETLKRELGVIVLDDEDRQKRLTHLASESHNLCGKQFFKDIHKPPALTNLSADLERIPQLQSNSKPAKYLRWALAEAVISEELSNNIFTAFYFPKDIKPSPESNELIHILDWLNRADTRRASICRSQLAIVCSQDENTGQKIASKATQRVLDILSPLISENRDEFANKLEELFTRAVKLWQPLQRADKRIVVSATNKWSDQTHWDLWEEYDDISLQQKSSPMPTYESLVILFPQIWAGSKLLFHGKALSPTQNAFIAAKLEHLEAEPNRFFSRSRRNTGNYIGDLGNRTAERRMSSTARGDATPRPTFDTRRETSFTGRTHSQTGPQREDVTASVSSTRSNSKAGVAARVHSTAI